MLTPKLDEFIAYCCSMPIPYFHIDAFTDRLHHGNPAGVCLLEAWPDDTVLQAIAAENNLSETAFLTGAGDSYTIRWFTPVAEIDLCGHATLASGFVLMEILRTGHERIVFHSPRSGPLSVTREGERFRLNFPARPAAPCEPPAALIRGLGSKPVEVLRAEDYLVVFDCEKTVRELRPDFSLLKTVGGRGVIITAPGEKKDFVSRFFCPEFGIDEDPVTGSSHCTLIPYWSRRLGKKRLQAAQLSARGGELFCEDLDDRVHIAGHAVCYMQGTIAH